MGWQSCPGAAATRGALAAPGSRALDVTKRCYWLTGTVGSSVRRYHDEAHASVAAGPTTTPIGVAIFAQDFQSIRRFADRDHANIISWNRFDRGSHFAPQDAPDLLVGDLRSFFRQLR